MVYLDNEGFSLLFLDLSEKVQSTFTDSKTN